MPITAKGNRSTAIPSKLQAEISDRSWSAAYPDYAIAVNCVARVSGRLDEQRLARAVRLSLDGEPILGCRFVERPFRPYWERYSDLDAIETLEFRSSGDCTAQMQQFIEAPPDLPMKVLLLRGESELLGIKLDHRVGDARAITDYSYMLADTYNRLKDDPLYRPIPNVKGSRSFSQIAGRFSMRDKWQVLRGFLNTNGEIKKMGNWKYPIYSGERQLVSVIGRLDADRIAAIWDYAYRHRATVNHVLMAAFYLAAYDALPHSPDLPLPMRGNIDLRRYLPSRKASAFCNLVGHFVVAVDPRTGNTMDAVVKQIRDQLYSQRGRLFGLAVSGFPFEGISVIRHAIGLIPYGYIKRMGRRTIEATEKRLQESRPDDHFRGIVLFSNSGEIESERFRFEGTQIADAFITTSVIKNPGLLGCGVSEFKGSLTLGVGFGPAFLVNGVFDRIMKLLPGGPDAD